MRSHTMVHIRSQIRSVHERKGHDITGHFQVDQRKFRQLQDPSKTEGELQKVGENPHCTQNIFLSEYKILESFAKPKSGLF